MKKRNYEDLIEAYVYRFGEGFPTFLAPPDEEECMDIIEECLRTGVPYDPDFDPEADY